MRNKKLYFITHKNRVVSVGLLRQIERTFDTVSARRAMENHTVFAAANKKACVENFIHYVGFTWSEWYDEGYRIGEVQT